MEGRIGKRLLLGLGLLLALAGGLDRWFPLPPTPLYSPIVTAADGTVLHAYLNPTQKWRLKTELAEITPALRTAIIAKEDRYFFYRALAAGPARRARPGWWPAAGPAGSGGKEGVGTFSSMNYKLAGRLAVARGVGNGR